MAGSDRYCDIDHYFYIFEIMGSDASPLQHILKDMAFIVYYKCRS
jgi:hypothetical protein